MGIKPTQSEYWDENDAPITPAEQSIVIERREIIGTIRLGSGTEPPLVAAYSHIGDWMMQNIQDAASSVNVEFRFGDHLFRATAEPVG